MRRLVLIALAGSCFATGMALAGTGGRAAIRAGSFTVNPGATEGAAVSCPPGKRALGGGVMPVTTITDDWIVRETGPRDTSGDVAALEDGGVAKQWNAAVANIGVTPDAPLKVFAICSGSVKAKVQTEQFVIESFEVEEGTVECPDGQRALGGGITQIGPISEVVFVLASGPLDTTGLARKTRTGDVARQWYASVVNDGGPSETMKVFAICARQSDATIVANTFAVPEPPDPQGQARARCEGNRRALGGGVVQLGPPEVSEGMGPSGPLEESGVVSETENGDTARYWFGSMTADEGDRAKTFAICD